MLRWHSVLQELVQARSVFGAEHAAIAIVEREIERLGLEPIAIPFDPIRLASLAGAQPPFCPVPGRRNVMARIAGSGGGRSLIVNCHLDTVPEGDPRDWTRNPLSGHIEDGVIHGRGTYDDKAGVVICLAILERMLKQQPRGDVIAQFVLEDETTGNGSLLCLEDGGRADAAIIVDGTRGDRGINEHAGNVRFGVTVFGAPASVSVSHVGVNAAEMLAQLLLEIRSAIFALNAANTPPWNQYPSPNQCSVVSMTCPETTMTVPALASATCYATFTPPHRLATFRDMTEGITCGFAARHGLARTPIVDWHFEAEPVRSHAEDLEAAIRTAAGDVPFGPSTGTSDLRHFVDRAIPCVLFGPGRGKNPHRPDESFDLASLDEMTAVIASAVEAWCA